MMRLATITDPTVHVRDNQSLVMSDFYVEQSDRHLLLEGKPDDPPGHVTIQGAKIHLNTEQPVLESQGFHGRVYLGNDQLYVEPKQPKFVTAGDTPLELVLSGFFLYNVVPQFTLSPATKLGRYDLSAGEHTLRFQCVGKNDSSKGHFFGLDVVELAPRG
jgi:hypothetical protein